MLILLHQHYAAINDSVLLLYVYYIRYTQTLFMQRTSLHSGYTLSISAHHKV